MADPCVSVLMGVYYRRADTGLLHRSVESVLAQSFSDFELLICDDGSTEAARNVLEAYERADPRMRLIRRGDAIRLQIKLNLCLKQARGAFIARMDDDDYSHPNRFARQLEALRENSDIAFIGCNARIYDGEAIVGRRVYPPYPRVKDFYMTQPFIHPTLMFRREALIRIGGYTEARYCDLCEDYDLLLRLYEAGFRGMNLQEALYDYTVTSVRGGRTMRHRWNEAVTRAKRFRSLGVLSRAFPYVIKPILVGLLPTPALSGLKRRRGRRQPSE